MSEQAVAQPQKTNTKQANTSQSAVIQRKCACGQHTVAGGECESCRKKRLKLQRWRKDKAEPALMSEMQPFSGSASGALMQPRFGHDFSQVRLRTGQPMIQRQPQGKGVLESKAMAEPASQPLTKGAPGPSTVKGETTSTKGAPTPKPATSKTALAEESTEPAAPGATAVSTLLVEDGVTELSEGQMYKSEFLGELRTAVCAAADAELAAADRDTEGCPYLDHWFDYYGQRDAGHIESALSRYAPQARIATSARDYIPLVVERVRQGVARWVSTGEVSGVPEGVPTTVPGEPPAESGPAVQAKARSGGAMLDDDPRAIQERLGNGRSLDSGVRSRMESAFSTSFSHVQMHTDGHAANLSSDLNARAFTVGEHVAFGTGEYHPGTPLGDALIAHELAHVIQQGSAKESVAPMEMGSNGYEALERDADRTAVDAITSLYDNTKGTLASISNNMVPSLRTGLSLQRCNKDTCSEGTKNVAVDMIKMRGSSRSPSNDIAEANNIYGKCCVNFTVGHNKTVPNALSDTWLGGDTDVAVASSCGAVDPEEKTMYDSAKLKYSLSSPMRVFFVETFSGHTALAYSIPPYCATGPASSYVNHAVIKNTAHKDTMAHELGHILLNKADHHGIDNPSDKNNLMFAPGRTGSDLDNSQCKIIYNNV